MVYSSLSFYRLEVDEPWSGRRVEELERCDARGVVLADAKENKCRIGQS